MHVRRKSYWQPCSILKPRLTSTICYRILSFINLAFVESFTNRFSWIAVRGLFLDNILETWLSKARVYMYGDGTHFQADIIFPSYLLPIFVLLIINLLHDSHGPCCPYISSRISQREDLGDNPNQLALCLSTGSTSGTTSSIPSW